MNVEQALIKSLAIEYPNAVASVKNSSIIFLEFFNEIEDLERLKEDVTEFVKLFGDGLEVETTIIDDKLFRIEFLPILAYE